MQSAQLVPIRTGIECDPEWGPMRYIYCDGFSAVSHREDHPITFRCLSKDLPNTVVPAFREGITTNFSVSFCNRFPRILADSESSFITLSLFDDKPQLTCSILLGDELFDLISYLFGKRHQKYSFGFVPDVETDFSYVDGDVLVFPEFPISPSGNTGKLSDRFPIGLYSIDGLF